MNNWKLKEKEDLRSSLFSDEERFQELGIFIQLPTQHCLCGALGLAGASNQITYNETLYERNGSFWPKLPIHLRIGACSRIPTQITREGGAALKSFCGLRVDWSPFREGVQGSVGEVCSWTIAKASGGKDLVDVQIEWISFMQRNKNRKGKENK